MIQKQLRQVSCWFLLSVGIALLAPARVAAFGTIIQKEAPSKITPSERTPTASRASTSTSMAASRRDVLVSSSIIIPGVFLPTPWTNAAAASNDASSSYQGVYSDPSHPRGYRILYGDGNKATMKLQNGPNSDVYETPVKVGSNKDGVQLTLDSSVKGEPSNVMTGVVGTKKAEGKDDSAVTTINFPDANTWTKITGGIAGVYKSENNNNVDLDYDFVSIRQWKGAEYKVELMKGADTIAGFGAKAGSKKGFFEYPGEFNKAGFIDPDGKTISFRDGIVWTRF